MNIGYLDERESDGRGLDLAGQLVARSADKLVRNDEDQDVGVLRRLHHVRDGHLTTKNQTQNSVKLGKTESSQHQFLNS